MYSKIINPITGRHVLITGKLGKTILKNYLTALRGGSSALPSVMTFAESQSRPTMLTENKIYEVLQQQPFEICGHYDGASGGYIMTDKGVNKSLGRASCTLSIQSPTTHIWHTHPIYSIKDPSTGAWVVKSSKCYPSKEDLWKILSNPYIKQSDIFVAAHEADSHGSWGTLKLFCWKIYANFAFDKRLVELLEFFGTVGERLHQKTLLLTASEDLAGRIWHQPFFEKYINTIVGAVVRQIEYLTPTVYGAEPPEFKITIIDQHGRNLISKSTII